MDKTLFKIIFILFFILSFLLQYLFYRKLKAENYQLRMDKDRWTQENRDYFERMNYYQEKKMHEMENKLRKEVYIGMHRSDENLMRLSHQLQKLDEQHLKMQDVSKELLSLQDILQNKSSRGVFGELQLTQILEAIFGEQQTKLYALQHRFSNGRQADAVVFAPHPLGSIAIDSKFPLENYERMLAEPKNKKHQRQFESDIKKHIDDIAERYIIEGETAEQAMMFIPAEAVYAQIYAHHQSLILYAQKKSVWIVSPSTLMGTLSMIQTIALRIQQNEEAEKIEKALQNLGVEFIRYEERWQQFSQRLERFVDDARKIDITSRKIHQEFENILAMNFDNDED